jgi:ribonuclease HI
VKGHNNDPENERYDALAVAASKGPLLLDDEGYQPNGDSEELL